MLILMLDADDTDTREGEKKKAVDIPAHENSPDMQLASHSTLPRTSISSRAEPAVFTHHHPVDHKFTTTTHPPSLHPRTSFSPHHHHMARLHPTPSHPIPFLYLCLSPAFPSRTPATHLPPPRPTQHSPPSRTEGDSSIYRLPFHEKRSGSR